MDDAQVKRLRELAERALQLARFHEGRADDCGALARLVVAALEAEQPKCGCGEPTALGVVHRAGRPCYVAEQPQPIGYVWTETHTTPDSPDGPAEHNEELCFDTEPPTSGEYIPVYAAPPVAAPTYGSIAERAAAGKDAGMWPAAAPSEVAIAFDPKHLRIQLDHGPWTEWREPVMLTICNGKIQQWSVAAREGR